MSALIELTKGKYALVDPEDYDKLAAHEWYFGSGGYAIRDTGGRKDRVRFKMHRVIMNAPDGMEVDHINGNRLDNRKENLRLCTRTENARNQLKRKQASSQYKGVCRDNRNDRWIAQITHDYQNTNLGSFHNELVAAVAYDKACRELFGEFGNPNFDDNTFQVYWSEFRPQIEAIKKRKGSSQYVGVHWSKKDNRWIAQIPHDKTARFVGHFTNELHAAIAREHVLRSEFADRQEITRNFPDSEFENLWIEHKAAIVNRPRAKPIA